MLFAICIFFSLGVVHLGSQTPAHAADPLPAPVVHKVLAFSDRIDDDIDEFRADLILKVPHGMVDPVTGVMQPMVDGAKTNQYLHVGYDYTGLSTGAKASAGYKNSLDSSGNYNQTGAWVWAHNQDQYFTIHEVVQSGSFDFLVMSIQGDMDLPNNNVANNVNGGRLSTMNWYFSYSTNAPGSSSSWVNSALTTYAAPFYSYYGASVYAGGNTSISGPQFFIPWDNRYQLWSSAQAHWGQHLDYGLNQLAPGVLPPNAIALDLMNRATRTGLPEQGYQYSISDRFWYAWVHEDGSLVTSINTKPIFVDGVTPRANFQLNRVLKNAPSATNLNPPTPTIAWTQDQADQGLTTKVGVDGSVDFTGAGGNGYYRLLAWPETRDPTNIPAAANAGGMNPSISYTAGDLFDPSGMMTATAQEQLWVPGTAFYNYQMQLPDAPVITVPENQSAMSTPNSVTISGTGIPGSTLTLKLKAGEGITSFTDTALTTIVDGEHNPATPSDTVVDAEGKWSVTYLPATPLADGTYSVVAVQTLQSGSRLTSAMSNPNPAENPTDWGVSFTVDTVVPPTPTLTCDAGTTTDQTPTITGSGVETGATVEIYQGDTRVGEAIVTGSAWSYTPGEALASGTYEFTASQTDAAGNESPRTTPPCQIQVAGTVGITAEKQISPVQHADASLVDVSVANWQITASSAAGTQVLHGDTPVQLERDTAYVIAERLRTVPDPAPETAAYVQVGDTVCLDGNGDPLPSSMFNTATSTLNIAVTADVVSPLSCELTNQTAQVSVMAKQLGEQPVLLPTGWNVALNPAETGVGDTSFTSATGTQRVRPGEVALTSALPAGLATIGFQQFDLAAPECQPLIADPLQAPETCWVQISEDGWQVVPGEHSMIRVVAGSPADLPGLPLTGGFGAWIPVALGSLVLLITTFMVVYRKQRIFGGILLRRPAHPPSWQ